MTVTSARPRPTIDKWASEPFPVLRTTRAKVMLFLLGAPALLPIIFMARSIVTLNGNTTHVAGNDVFGTGGILLLFVMLSVTPLRTLTRRQWFVPLRRWYGIAMAFSIFLDAILASNDTAFNGGPVAELAGHTFLLVGLTMTLLLVPLCVQGIWNKWSQKQLGKYWKPVQQYGTYGIWGLLGLHLALLEGLLPDDEPAPYNVLHQRVYQYLSLSVLMIVLRIPPVRRWVRAKQQEGRSWKIYASLGPLFLLFLAAFVLLVNELIFKGAAAASLNPIDD